MSTEPETATSTATSASSSALNPLLPNSNTTMVASLADLLERMEKVAEQQWLASEPFDSPTYAADLKVIAMLGLPCPADATTQDLIHLKPLYNELIKDLREMKQESVFLRPLFPKKIEPPDGGKVEDGKRQQQQKEESKDDDNGNGETKTNFASRKSVQDATLMILYFLEYPGLVRSAYMGSNNKDGTHTPENFELNEAANEILLNRILGKWCRDALTPQQHRQHHAAVLASVVSLFSSLNQHRPNKQQKQQQQRDEEQGGDEQHQQQHQNHEIGKKTNKKPTSVTAPKLPPPKTANSKTRKFVQSVVLLQSSNKPEALLKGYRALRSDLAHIVSHRTDLHHQTIANIILLMYHIVRIVYGNDDDIILEIMHESAYVPELEAALEKIKDTLGEDSHKQLFRLLGCQAKIDLSYAPPLEEWARCSASNCPKPGLKRCVKCKVANYCSRECQTRHWREGHKSECQSMKLGHARAKQNSLLRQHPGVDYILYLPDGSLHAVRFGLQMATEIFAGLRQHALAGTPFAVCRMYDILSEHQPPEYAHLFCKQLKSEYGVDPLSKEARDSDPTKQPNYKPHLEYPNDPFEQPLPRDDPYW